jgi:hypothetical protein
LRLNALRFALTRRVAGTAIAALAAVTTVVALAAPSALAVTPTVTVTTSYENSPISLNTSDAVGYAFKNTFTVPETVTFTDTLPPGVTLDSPIGLTNTAGTSPNSCSNITVTNPATGQPSASGDGAVTVSATVSAGSGTICTISLSIVAGTPSVADAPLQDAYSNVSPAGITTTAGSLVVLTNPTLAFTAPTNNQTFALGQVFDANFNCAATDPLDSIDSFFGTDDEGNQIASGAPIDTVDPGSRSLEVDCYSAAGGGDFSESINYKVGSYTLTAVKTTKTDQVSFRSAVPAGRFVAEVIDAKKVIGTTRLTVAARKRASITVKPTTAGKKLLAATKGKLAKVQLHVAFTPQAIGSGDSQIAPAAATVVTRNLKLRIAHVAK